MKYKVILYNNSGSSETDKAANFTFFRLNEATDCCEQWIELQTDSYARMWNGSQWLTFSQPIP